MTSSSVVMTTFWPVVRMTFSWSLSRPVRISGPLVSSMMATVVPSSLAMRRTRSMLLRW